MVTADLIIPCLSVTSKKQAFRAIAEETSRLLRMMPDDLLDALLARERIGSTGIGGGVAIPHVKVENISRAYGILVRLEKPVDYDSPDKLPVDIMFALVVPAGSRTTEHLKTLAHVSRFLRDADVCAGLRGTKESARITEIIMTWSKTIAA